VVTLPDYASRLGVWDGMAEADRLQRQCGASLDRIAKCDRRTPIAMVVRR